MRRTVSFPVLALLVLLVHIAHGASITYGAAQYSPRGMTNATSPEAFIDMQTTQYEWLIEQAAAASVDVLVFPEGTLGWIVASSRAALLPYCAAFATPSLDEPVLLCDGAADAIDADADADTAATPASVAAVRRIACTAQQYRTVVIINVCDMQSCGVGDACRADGLLLRNTLLVIDGRTPGAPLLRKYYKSHLFTEAAMFDALPPAQRNLDSAWFEWSPVASSSSSLPLLPPVVVSSPPLPIGLLTCFDVEFAYPTVPLQRTRRVSHILMSSWWVNTLPLFHAAAFQQAYSRVTESVLVAANSGLLRASGGGVWSDGRALAWSYNASGDDADRIHVATVSLDREAPAASALSAWTAPPPVPLPAAPASFPCRFWLWSGMCATLQNDVALRATTAGVNVAATVTHNAFTCAVRANLAPVSAASSAQQHAHVAFAFQGDLRFPDTPDFLSLEICALLVCAAGARPPSPGAPIECGSTTTAPAVVASFEARADFSPAVVVFPMFLGDRGSVLADPVAATRLVAAPLPSPSNRTAYAFASADTGGAFEPMPLLALSMYGIDQSMP